VAFKPSVTRSIPISQDGKLDRRVGMVGEDRVGKFLLRAIFNDLKFVRFLLLFLFLST
jgi:hypothetical protein